MLPESRCISSVGKRVGALSAKGVRACSNCPACSLGIASPISTRPHLGRRRGWRLHRHHPAGSQRSVREGALSREVLCSGMQHLDEAQAPGKHGREIWRKLCLHVAVSVNRTFVCVDFLVMKALLFGVCIRAPGFWKLPCHVGARCDASMPAPGGSPSQVLLVIAFPLATLMR